MARSRMAASVRHEERAELGEAERARTRLQQALARDPDFPEAGKARALLREIESREADPPG